MTLELLERQPKKMNKQKHDYNQDWSSHFIIDQSSPSGLVKIINEHENTIKLINVGNRQFDNGVPNSWRLDFKGKKYVIHRIIWVLKYGNIDPELIIDHLDGNPFNNKIENLKLKTLRGNQRNKGKQNNNTTGTTGVSLVETKEGEGYYVASWCEIDGKLKQKRFSIKKNGEEKAKADAIIYRNQQIQRLILEGAGYTERHGN